MTGLDQMKQAILEESQKSAEHVLAQARKEAEELLAQAKAEAQEQADTIISEADYKKELELKKAQSGSELMERKTLLGEKAKLIEETMALALTRLRGLPPKEYFDVVKRLVCANAREGKGEIVFSKTDLERLPTGFEAELNRALPHGSVVICQRAGAIPDGFLLVYGDIEQNCSFEALMESSVEEIKDLLYRALFG